MKQYNRLCADETCFTIVTENDIERDKEGVIYERSKKCWDCRTKQDRDAIKKWRSKHRN